MDRQSYLQELTGQIRTKRARQMVAEEIEDHIEDQKNAYIAEGMTEQEAEENAILEMGDPVEVGVQLDRIHRPKMEWKVFAGVLIMSMIGLALQMMIVSMLYPVGEADRGILIVLGVNRQIVGIGLGIVLMLVICYLDYSVLARAAFPAWIVLLVLIVLFSVSGYRMINGISRAAVLLSYLLIPVYAGVVYRFRGQGVKGLVKSGICLLPILMAVFKGASISSSLTIGVTGFVILNAAIYKKWFGEKRKKPFLILWGTVAGLAVVGLAALMLFQHILLAGYQEARWEAYMNQECWNFMQMLVAQTADELRIGNAPTMDIDSVMQFMRNDYLWTYVFHYLGTWKGIVLLVVFVTFMVVLFRMAVKQKNQLGYIVSIGCVSYLSIQALFYVQANLGNSPLGGNYMPFFSHGISTLLTTYFYMGLLLSIYRNSNVVRN